MKAQKKEKISSKTKKIIKKAPENAKSDNSQKTKKRSKMNRLALKNENSEVSKLFFY